MSNFLIYLIPICLLWFCSCEDSKSHLSKYDLVKFLENPKNGLYQEKIINGVHIGIRYTPNELLNVDSCNYNTINNYQSKDLIDSGNLKSTNCFILTISKNGKEAIREFGTNAYSVLLQTLAFEMDKYVYLTSLNSDTARLNFSFFDQSYGLNYNNKILLVFDPILSNKNSAIKLHFDEFGLGVGSFNFSFNQIDINNIPSF